MESQESLIDQLLVVINLGLQDFAGNPEKQDVDVIHVDWRPPAGGDQEMIELLDKLL